MKGIREIKEAARNLGLVISYEKKRELRLTRREVKRICERLSADGIAVVSKRGDSPAKVYSREGFEASVASAKKHKPWKAKMAVVLAALALMTGLMGCEPATADTARIDMAIIMSIESHGDPFAYNKGSKATGLFQITPIVLEEFNSMGRYEEQLQMKDLFDPYLNQMVATWYMGVRIPAMLRHFGIPVTVRNMLVSYNAGITYAFPGKKLPKETRDYILKYQRGGGAL